MDIITALPQGIIEIILCFLPIEEAARTSILSTKWRYKWTTIPKLAFNHHMTAETSAEERRLFTPKYNSDREHKKSNMYRKCKLFNAIHQVLLQRQGPIHEFDLWMDVDDACVEIDQIMLHLSRNHALKKLTLRLAKSYYGPEYGLPLYVFSSQRHLTDLCLHYSEVSLKPMLDGLGSVTSLTLNRVVISRAALLHLLSKCPSLKTLSIMLENHRRCYDNASIMELFKCLTPIEHLTTWGHITQLVKDRVPEELTTSLINLKYFCMVELDYGDGNALTFLGILTKCSPNLEKIKLEIKTNDSYHEISGDELEEYSDFWLEHFHELEIKNYRNTELELEFVEFILARTPNLKKVILSGTVMRNWEEESEMILDALRSSPVEIVIEKSPWMIKFNFVRN